MDERAEQQSRKYLAELLKTLIAVIEEKDLFIRGFSEKVAQTCVYFSRKLGLSKNEIDRIYIAAMLHDIGMVFVPLEILHKNDSLSDDEMQTVTKHPTAAERILSHFSAVKDMLPIIRHHHEAFDGSGYPDGLKGAAIPLGARIVHLVDCYVALTSKRAYRDARGMEEALEEIKGESGAQFDKALFDKFDTFIRTSAVSAEAASREGEAHGTKPLKKVQKIITDIVQRFEEGKLDLPVLPHVVNDVEDVIKKPGFTMDDLAKVIERDASVSIRLISIANSPIYRGAEKISSVRQAVPRLGISETRSVVTAIASKGLYKTRHVQFRKMMERLWMHSL